MPVQRLKQAIAICNCFKMHFIPFKKIHICCFLSSCAATMLAHAEGIIDIRPSVNASVNYDDNVYRFSSPERAKQFLGSSNTGDTMKQVGLGLNVDLRLSRQLIHLTSNINKNSFDRFKSLDSTGKSNALRWDWQIGNDLNGQLGISERVAVSGFNETRTQERNLITTQQKFANLNWNFIPDWSFKASREQIVYDNDTQSNLLLNREDEVYETGLNYQNQLNTNLGLSYRVVDSTSPSRTGLILSTLGDESTQKEIILTAAWSPAAKTKLSTRLSKVSLERKNSTVDQFDGFNQRWSLDYSPTGKINLNLSAYKLLLPVDDVVSSYVETKGISISPNWSLTSKLLLRSSLGHEQRNYIGSAGLNFNNEDRADESNQASLSLIYTPTIKSVLQLQYQGENRTTNQLNTDYKYNNLNLSFSYAY